MAWEKATYWLAVALLALTAGNAFVNRHRDWAGEIANRSLQMADQISGRAMAYMNLAEMTVGRDETRFIRAQTKLACVQTRLASLDVVMAREQAGLTKLAAERVRLAEMEQLRLSVICPRRGLTIMVPQPAALPHQGTI